MNKALLAAMTMLAAAIAAQLPGCARETTTRTGACIKQCVLDGVTSSTALPVRRQLEK